MREQEISITSGDALLSGTLCTPDTCGQYPAVLMVHGSGPLDRNGNMKGQALNVFNTLAHALADQGIASLRYDKRGCGRSSGNFLKTGHYDFVEDAIQSFDALKIATFTDKNRLYILGHSEGCIVAPQVSQRRQIVAGLILLCPFIDRVEPMLTRQAEQLEKEIGTLNIVSRLLYRALFRLFGRPTVTQRRLIARVKKTDSEVIRSGLSRQPAKWLRELLELDSKMIFAATTAPMLLIAGDKDLQCCPQDIFRIAEVTQNEPDVLLVKGMNHTLRVDSAPASLFGMQRLFTQPIEYAVIETTERWIHALPASSDK